MGLPAAYSHVPICRTAWHRSHYKLLCQLKARIQSARTAIGMSSHRSWGIGVLWVSEFVAMTRSNFVCILLIIFVLAALAVAFDLHPLVRRPISRLRPSDKKKP